MVYIVESVLKNIMIITAYLMTHLIFLKAHSWVRSVVQALIYTIEKRKESLPFLKQCYER